MVSVDSDTSVADDCLPCFAIDLSQLPGPSNLALEPSCLFGRVAAARGSARTLDGDPPLCDFNLFSDI